MRANRILNRTKLLLPVKLTIDEKVQKGRELAEALEEIGREESRAEMVKQSLKGAMAALEAKRDELRMVVSRGEMVRDVEVEDIADDQTQRVYRTRTDTGEVIHERSQTPEEKQVPLPLEESAPGGDLIFGVPPVRRGRRQPTAGAANGRPGAPHG